MIRLKSKFIVRVYNNFKFPCGKYYGPYAQILNSIRRWRGQGGKQMRKLLKCFNAMNLICNNIFVKGGHASLVVH